MGKKAQQNYNGTGTSIQQIAMKKIITLIIANILILLLAGCSKTPVSQAPSPKPDDSAAVTEPAAPAPQPVATTPSAPKAPVGIKSQVTAKTAPAPTPQLITIQFSTYKPSTLTVAKGTIIKWVNKDNMPHTVTSDSGAFQSGLMQEGDFFTYQFDTAGNFPYHCKLHPSMKGGIIVKP